jgi:hypothetical protein
MRSGGKISARAQERDSRRIGGAFPSPLDKIHR